jgi:hypothetical protein
MQDAGGTARIWQAPCLDGTGSKHGRRTMNWMIEMLATVFLNDRVIGVLDAVLLAMGLTMTVASLAPALARVLPSQKDRR